jgi:hypothetical protein
MKTLNHEGRNQVLRANSNNNIYIRLFLCLTKYYTMEAYGGVDV